MPSLLGHAVAGLAIASAFRRDQLPRRTWALAAACAMAPDLDWFLSFLNIQRNHICNHRGMTHALFAALLIAGAVTWAGFRRDQRSGRIWLLLTLAALSHGLMDACTSGGVGVALFMPFSDSRWGCIWQPLQVAPLPDGPAHLLTFLSSLWTEAVWIGLPALLLSGFSRIRRAVSHIPVLSEAAPEF